MGWGWGCVGLGLGRVGRGEVGFGLWGLEGAERQRNGLWLAAGKSRFKTNAVASACHVPENIDRCVSKLLAQSPGKIGDCAFPILDMVVR